MNCIQVVFGAGFNQLMGPFQISAGVSNFRQLPNPRVINPVDRTLPDGIATIVVVHGSGKVLVVVHHV